MHQLLIFTQSPKQPSALSLESELKWCLFTKGDTNLNIRTSKLSDIAAQASQTLAKTAKRRVTVVLSGEQVQLTQVDIPSQSAKHIRQALPYLVADQVVEPMETLHLAVPEKLPRKDGKVPVAIVRHQILINIIDVLSDAGLEPDAIIPETLCVPWSAASQSMLWQPTRCLIRQDALSAQSVTSNLFQPVAEASMASSAHREMVIYSTAGTEVDSNVQAFVASYPDQVKLIQLKESVEEVLAVNAIDDSLEKINLLQGGYAASASKTTEKTGGKFYSLVAFAAVLLVGLCLGSGWYFNKQADLAYQHQISIFKKVFPERRRIVNPRKEMARHLNGGQSQDTQAGIIEILQWLASAKGEVGSSVQIERLKFNGPRRNSELEVFADNVNTLSALQKALEQYAAGDVKLVSASNTGNNSRGIIRMSL